MVTLYGYQFNGPYDIDSGFKEVPGIYIIYTSFARFLDVGSTDALGSRITEHDRKSCWAKNANGSPIYLAFMRVDDGQKRLAIESYLRDKLNPTCGEK